MCDFCGRPRSRDPRSRLVWASPFAADVVLADLCSHCAAQADGLLEMYGGRGRDAISLVQSFGALATPTPRKHRAFASVGRIVVYIMIALAFFVIVTLVTSHVR